MSKNTVPEYTRRAIDNYNKTVKRVTVSIKLEEWEELNKYGIDSKSIKPIIMAELARRKAAADQQGAQAETIKPQDTGSTDQHDNDDALQLPFDF